MKLIVFLMCLCVPTIALAQSMPPMHTEKNGNVTITSPGGGVHYYSDDNRNTATTYDVSPGVRWYGTQNHDGTSSQGYIYDYSQPSQSTTPKVPDSYYRDLDRAYERMRER